MFKSPCIDCNNKNNEKDFGVCRRCRENGKLNEWQNVHKYNISYVDNTEFKILRDVGRME